jgi:CDP-diglyceride synthetase
MMYRDTKKTKNGFFGVLCVVSVCVFVCVVVYKKYNKNNIRKRRQLPHTHQKIIQNKNIFNPLSVSFHHRNGSKNF